MAQMHYLHEGYGWVRVSKLRTGEAAEVSVYERGDELVVVTWIRGIWTAVFCNGDLSIAEYGPRRGDVLQKLRKHRPQIAAT